MKTANIVEIVLFKPKADVSREQILITLNTMQTVVEQKSGYISRQVLENEDGQWIDIVHWETLDDALTAAKEVETDATIAPHFAIFADAEMQMMHLHPVALERAQ